MRYFRLCIAAAYIFPGFVNAADIAPTAPAESGLSAVAMSPIDLIDRFGADANLTSIIRATAKYADGTSDKVYIDSLGIDQAVSRLAPDISLADPAVRRIISAQLGGIELSGEKAIDSLRVEKQIRDIKLRVWLVEHNVIPKGETRNKINAQIETVFEATEKSLLQNLKDKAPREAVASLRKGYISGIIAQIDTPYRYSLKTPANPEAIELVVNRIDERIKEEAPTIALMAQQGDVNRINIWIETIFRNASFQLMDATSNPELKSVSDDEISPGYSQAVSNLVDLERQLYAREGVERQKKREIEAQFVNLGGPQLTRAADKDRDKVIADLSAELSTNTPHDDKSNVSAVASKAPASPSGIPRMVADQGSNVWLLLLLLPASIFVWFYVRYCSRCRKPV